MNDYREMHNDYPNPALDNAIADALDEFFAEHRGIRQFFSDLIEARPWANAYQRGITIYRTDTNEVLEEVDYD